MKVEDLMVGDWVYITEYPMRKEAKQVKPEHFLRSLVTFEPIPLTPEILEKNGFEEINNKTQLSLECSNFYFGYYSTNHMTVYNKNTGTLIHKVFNYVHELQHAIVFCEIDKEIKL